MFSLSRLCFFLEDERGFEQRRVDFLGIVFLLEKMILERY